MEIPMRNERIAATREVAGALYEAEAALDVALAAAAKLNAVMPLARASAKISSVIGQGAFESAGATFAALMQARHALVETHGKLDDVKTEIGLRELAMGGLMRKPFVEGHLRVVTDLAA